MTHKYLSTACEHGLHDQCRRFCKWCPSLCNCRDAECQCSKVETGVPDMIDGDLDEVDLEALAPEMSMMLRSLEKPRSNLGSSGPPGRVD